MFGHSARRPAVSASGHSAGCYLLELQSAAGLREFMICSWSEGLTGLTLFEGSLRWSQLELPFKSVVDILLVIHCYDDLALNSLDDPDSTQRPAMLGLSMYYDGRFDCAPGMLRPCTDMLPVTCNIAMSFTTIDGESM